MTQNTEITNSLSILADLRTAITNIPQSGLFDSVRTSAIRFANQYEIILQMQVDETPTDEGEFGVSTQAFLIENFDPEGNLTSEQEEVAFRQWAYNVITLGGLYRVHPWSYWHSLNTIDLARELQEVINSSARGAYIREWNTEVMDMLDDFLYTVENRDLILLDVHDPISAETLRTVNPSGRPIIILAHGFNASSPGTDATYAAWYQYYQASWANLPPDQQPIIIGVNWDSWMPLQGQGLDQSLVLVDILETYQRTNRDVQISMIGQSGGGEFVARIVQNSDVVFNVVILQQAVFNQTDVQNRFPELVNSDRVGTLIVTLNPEDGTSRAYEHHFIDRDPRPTSIGWLVT